MTIRYRKVTRGELLIENRSRTTYQRYREDNARRSWDLQSVHVRFTSSRVRRIAPSVSDVKRSRRRKNCCPAIEYERNYVLTRADPGCITSHERRFSSVRTTILTTGMCRTCRKTNACIVDEHFPGDSQRNNVTYDLNETFTIPYENDDSQRRTRIYTYNALLRRAGRRLYYNNIFSSKDLRNYRTRAHQ